MLVELHYYTMLWLCFIAASLVSVRSSAQLGLAAKQAGLGGASFSLKQRSTESRVAGKWKSNVTVSLHDAKHTGLDIAGPCVPTAASFTSIYETWH